MGLNSIWPAFLQKKALGHRHIQRKDHVRLREKQLPLSQGEKPQKKSALQTPWSGHTHGLQNFEQIHARCWTQSVWGTPSWQHKQTNNTWQWILSGTWFKNLLSYRHEAAKIPSTAPHPLPLMNELHHWHRESTPGKFTLMVSDVPGAGTTISITISALLSIFRHISNSMRKRAAGREGISDNHYPKTSCRDTCGRDLVYHHKHISAFSMLSVLLSRFRSTFALMQPL